ncbi:response regulator transcription factor [Paenibacillus aquistagni]|uniref:response regulator transcription factor n=1 Tax=Paenibacillus aquistagni TaxID=1852522 RepID=UPI000B4FE747|nr:response regulator transcription factor [Paenibacillus aquistagni]NMM51628.1 response regulator transcription factor [Paenibacillus aquistagni]
MLQHETKQPILVVEDDQHIQRFIRINLERSGFEVISSSTGTEALQAVEHHQPDVIILDVMLPDIDGFECCERIRAKDPHVVIMFLTAKGQDLDKIRGLELGADDYIVKPFNPLELVARINSVLRRTQIPKDPLSSASSRHVLTAGPLRLDIDANRLYKHDQAIELTPKEYAVIKVFMEHPDKALTRDDLLNLAWGEDFVGDPKTIDVHVRKLREKLEDDSSHPQWIETVWGRGYRLRKDG